ncbi:CPL domain protein [Teladorsagia circumcincta]|uniref:CPL domain protein n=1 Tax=Teladorsagia circumcincta TaxID=45464 RepID=A0A2G9UZ63_TELCI|nr:CPL domain protein [Teladorsagia circumcincta]
MTKNKYAHFFVLRMLKYGTKEQRNMIISSFRGHAVSLMRIVYAAEVLEVAYNEYANAQQRFDIISEFYGKEFVLFRLIVKNFKDLAVKVAMEHYGHRVLLALFDTIDDTVLINKYITTGDSNPFSKKQKKDRYAEIYRNICESLYAYLASNMESLIFEHNRSKFIAACLETTSSYDLFDRQVPAEMRQKCNEALAQIAKQEFIPMDNERLHLIEHPAGHFVLMAVLRCDNALAEDQRLSVEIVNTLSKEDLGSWICCNKGCHVLLKMLHCGSSTVKRKVKEAVNMKQLKEYTFRGATLLADELAK